MILKYVEKNYLKDNLPHVLSLKHINTCGDSCIQYGMTKLRILYFKMSSIILEQQAFIMMFMLRIGFKTPQGQLFETIVLLLLKPTKEANPNYLKKYGTIVE